MTFVDSRLEVIKVYLGYYETITWYVYSFPIGTSATSYLIDSPKISKQRLVHTFRNYIKTNLRITRGRRKRNRLDEMVRESPIKFTEMTFCRN